MGDIAQWDTRWFDKFKMLLATNLTTLSIYPGTPLSWITVRDIAFGQKQVQPHIRKPDQRVHVSKNVEYVDKEAERLIQVADMPSVTDSLKIPEEYYAGDPVNALGHVGDLSENYLDGLKQHYIIGEAVDPLSYGLIDTGAGTGSTTQTRPDIITAVTTAGVWDTAANVLKDLSALEASLITNGFNGQPIICTHPRVKPYFNLLAMTNTATPYGSYITMAGGYPLFFCEYWDADATKDAVDVYMVDSTAFTIYQTPVIARAHWNPDTEHYYWRWKTRGVVLPSKIRHDGTDWKKGMLKVAVDLVT